MGTNFLRAVALLVGTIIGAGVLGIPYVVAKAGLWTGLLAIALLGGALLILHLYLGEIALRTKGIHQITGYAEKYLGHWGKSIMLVVLVFSIYGALVAYIIGFGATSNAIFGGGELMWSLILFVAMSIFVYMGLRTVGNVEIIGNMCVVLIILTISVISAFNIKPENLQGFNMFNLLVPYGVIFFAFIGTSAIPGMREILVNKKELKKAIIIGSLIPLAIYFIFALTTVGAIGDLLLTLDESQRIASVALGLSPDLFGPIMNVLANLFAVFAMATSFVVLGLALMWVFQYDYGIRKKIAFFLTISIPLAIALSHVTNFVSVLSIVGGVAGGMEGIMIVLMHRKAKKLGKRKPEYSIHDNIYVSIILIALFVIGIFYVFL